MKFSKRRLIRENLTESCQKAKHTRIVVLKKKKTQPAKGADRSAPARAPLPRLHKSRVKDRPAPGSYLLGITHGAPRTEPASVRRAQSRDNGRW